MKRVGTLEVTEDWEFQKKEWLFERVGWVFLFVLLLAAVLGFSGSGPLSQKKVESSDGALKLTYGRYVRWQTTEFLEIEFGEGVQERMVTIPRSLLERWSIQNITPEPERVVAGKSGTEYRFAGEGPGQVQFEYQAKKVGSSAGALLFPGGRSLEVKQFALP